MSFLAIVRDNLSFLAYLRKAKSQFLVMDNPDQAEKKKIGLEIATGRTLLELSQEEFAKMLGVSLRSLGRYESGETMPDALVYRKILRLFGNITLQESVFIPVTRVHMVTGLMIRGSKNLKIIKTCIFDAVINNLESFVYPGRLSSDEIMFLNGLGYKVEIKDQLFIIGNL